MRSNDTGIASLRQQISELSALNTESEAARQKSHEDSKFLQAKIDNLEQEITTFKKPRSEADQLKTNSITSLQGQISSLESKHQSEMDELQTRIIHLEQRIRDLSQDKRIVEEDKSRLQFEKDKIVQTLREEIRELNQTREGKDKTSKRREPEANASKKNTQPKGRKRRGKGKATKPTAVEGEDGSVQQEDSKELEEAVFWNKLAVIEVCIAVLLLILVCGIAHLDDVGGIVELQELI
jgi:cell division protein FtsB